MSEVLKALIPALKFVLYMYAAYIGFALLFFLVILGLIALVAVKAR